ncbi:MAG: NAD(P)-dependent alcohol dehydrogenase [Arhodomonas sp.]|nr:NAD(P)-dependent alcohol dehydrogenase [Arhodomonas sp.]
MQNKTVFLASGGGFDNVSVADGGEPPAPAAGEVTVRIRASSLNFHDYGVVTGATAPKETRIPMADGAGEVTAVGAEVDEFSVGDPMVSTFFPNWLDGPPRLEGFATTPGDGVDGYAREKVYRPGDWPSPRAPADYQHMPRRRRLSHCGRMSDSPWVASKDRSGLTGGQGVDHVVEVGGPGTLEQSMRACRVGGHIAVIGVLTGVKGDFPLRFALMRQLRLDAVLVGSRQHQMQLVDALEASEIRPVIDRHFPLEELVEAFRHEESGRHFGKICLDI